MTAFYCLELLPEAIKKIESIVEYRFCDKYLHHCTLGYKPSENNVAKITRDGTIKDGDSAYIEIVYEAFSDWYNVQALVVEPKLIDGSSLYCVNEIPHITVSTGEHIAPKVSNDMLIDKKNPPTIKHLSVNYLILPAIFRIHKRN